jgi:hypothetical protein
VVVSAPRTRSARGWNALWRCLVTAIRPRCTSTILITPSARAKRPCPSPLVFALELRALDSLCPASSLRFRMVARLLLVTGFHEPHSWRGKGAGRGSVLVSATRLVTSFRGISDPAATIRFICGNVYLVLGAMGLHHGATSDGDRRLTGITAPPVARGCLRHFSIAPGTRRL